MPHRAAIVSTQSAVATMSVDVQQAATLGDLGDLGVVEREVTCALSGVVDRLGTLPRTGTRSRSWDLPQRDLDEPSVSGLCVGAELRSACVRAARLEELAAEPGTTLKQAKVLKSSL